MDKTAKFAIEVYGKDFLSDYVKTETLDSLTGDELRTTFDDEFVKTLCFMTWRWDSDKGIMIPIADSVRKAKVSIGSGRPIKLKDYDVSGEIIEVDSTQTSGGDRIFNGGIIEPGSVVEFHWSEAAMWGCVYNIESGEDVIVYQPTRNYLVPEEFSPKFRRCGARGTKPEMSVAVADKLNGQYFAE